MEISPRKPSKRAQEPIDEWLQNEGYFRKHAPRDPTCLFRAVSEQVYMTQHYHIRVRKECVKFMRHMKHLFIENVTIPFDDYLEQMACFTEWGGMNEIHAMSLLYEKEFVIFNGQKQIQRTVTNNGFTDTIYLCHTPQKQYESIYTRDFVANAAYCQSIVYQVLYENVFQMPNIESIVYKMLHDRSTTFRHDKFFLKGNLDIRDQLTTEIYNKVENGNDEVDDAQTVVKNIPPFPYRVAKALDPNIYRNTDFDIWHEIRREVKNAGWIRHNSHELQVGGKCLVQMDYNEEEFDKANNNSIYVPSLEKDSNGNDTKAQKKGKQDPVFFYGHIQEMGKNQGPVLVFIEELGEKKIVPHSALKPLPLRKNKQSNWLPICRKNILLDSNQKWKKPCGSSSRKIKESNILSANNDKNGNIESNVKSGNNFQIGQWKDESMKIEQQTYDSYTMEKCPNYSVNNSAEVFPPRMILDNAPSSGVESVRQENGKERKEKNSFANKNSENNFIKNSKFDGIMNGDNAGFNSYSKQRNQKESYYSPYSGEHVSSTQMDHMLQSINCSVQKSVDVNGSDLPLSDPFTLRFFYNLGLEYFRGNNNWNYLTNGQSSFGQWYQGIPPNEENITHIANGIMQDCTLMQQRKEYSNNQKDIGTQSQCQENADKYVNGMMKDTQAQNAGVLRAEEGTDSLYLSRDKVKEQEFFSRDSSRISRTGLGPRFKKNSDNRQHNVQQFPQSSNQYPQGGSNSKPSKSQDTKEDTSGVQHSHSVPQVHVPTGAMISYQGPYMQQGMYSGLPYYANEAEAFANPYYPPNPGYFPVPCLPPSDAPENNNVQQFSPLMCPGVDYTQGYSGLCAPYMCTQPAPYNIPPQNMQEHWYAVAGQPHYMQYAPAALPIATETTCNSVGQNVSQITSS